jgi:hypothetical protein
MNAQCCQFFEDPVKAIILRRCGSPYLAIAAPDNRDAIGFHIGHIAC